MDPERLIHVTIPGHPGDPRVPEPVPHGVVAHYTPDLHPDDVCSVDGIFVTSPSRTLIDLSEVTSREELRQCFHRARELGLLDPEALAAARDRVEWRPSLRIFDEVLAEFLE